jgi:hypothetical protein
MPIKRKVIKIRNDVKGKNPKQEVIDNIILTEKERIANDLYMKIADIRWDVQIDRCLGVATITYKF